MQEQSKDSDDEHPQLLWGIQKAANLHKQDFSSASFKKSALGVLFGFVLFILDDGQLNLDLKTPR